MTTRTEIQTILADAISRSRSHTERVSIGVMCDISELMAELDGILEAGIEADYARENDGRYDIWGYDPEAAEGEMEWRLSVLCGDTL